MGSKVVQWCDTCGRSLDNRKSIRIVEKEGCYDVCDCCVRGIVQKVFDKELLNLSPWCKVCKGTREVEKKDFSSGHHYNRTPVETEPCKACKV